VKIATLKSFTVFCTHVRGRGRKSTHLKNEKKEKNNNLILMGLENRKSPLAGFRNLKAVTFK